MARLFSWIITVIMRSNSWNSIGFGFVLLLVIVVSGTVLAQDDKPSPDRPTATADPQATPTADRLAPPPPVLQPTQADNGEYLYWVWCQPCHGDKGQGLTDEWREQYPEEEQYCWNQGCHGSLPYEEGFTLPKHIPAVIGEQSLLRFQTMNEIYDYTKHKMPFEYPGALDEQKALAVTAFLAREHGKWDGTTLTIENIDQFRWQPLPTPTPRGSVFDMVQELAEGEGDSTGRTTLWGAALAGVLIIGLVFIGGIILWRQRH